MAIINIGRFRDVLVRSRVSDEAPAMEVSVGLERELDETLSQYSTRQETMNSFELLRAEFASFRSDMRAAFAEQEQRAKEREQRYVMITLGAITLAVAVIGLMIAFL